MQHVVRAEAEGKLQLSVSKRHLTAPRSIQRKPQLAQKQYHDSASLPTRRVPVENQRGHVGFALRGCLSPLVCLLLSVLDTFLVRQHRR